MSCFGRVKSALDSSPLFTPDFFASCLLIEGGLQIPQFHRSNIFLQRIANPLGRLTEDRRLTESVRNPWSKNALLTQRNPMNKNIQVKSELREFSGIMQKLFPYKKYQVGVQFLRWF